MVYGHYDVMPVDPVELWESSPFEPEIRDGKIFARGADDDKGQSFMHAKALEYMVETETLPCNIKFLFEGEEEEGSPSLPGFCRDHKELLKCDVILVSDTGMISSEIPAVTTGLRGLTYWEVEVTGPDHDLHSGVYGGAVVNPLNALCSMISLLINEQGKITIPGFYDRVLDVSPEERELINEAASDENEYMNSIGVNGLTGEQGYTTIERTGIRPSLDVCGIRGGYTGEGAKTVLPSSAKAKISCRLVPDQDHNEISELFGEYFKSLAPEGVSVSVEYLHGGAPYVCPVDSGPYRAAEKALSDLYGRTPLPIRSGGSIPVIPAFEEILGVKSLLMGFGLDSDSIHSPNECFPVEQFFRGIEGIVGFYRAYEETIKDGAGGVS